MQENKQPIQVKMTDRRYVRTEPIYQYDVGHTLDLSVFAAMLPETFQVHFGRSLMGDSITQIGQNCSCPVPDMYAQTAAPIYAWLYIPETETGLTKYTIEIPVQRRARITNQEPTPVERSAIDQEIAALNAGVERAEDAAEAAEAAQAGAEAAEQGASAAEASAGASAALAAQKAELATQEADRAEAAVEDVTEVAEQAAADLGGIVRDAQTQIAGSVQQAQQAAQAASGSATAAAGSAGAAAGSATAADQSAQAAAQKKEQMDARADEIEEEFTSLKSDIEANREGLDELSGAFDEHKEYAENTYAKQDGYYADMTVGNAEQLVSSKLTEDQVPYLLRPAGGTNDIGNREYKEAIVGGTIAWNQLVRDEASDNVTEFADIVTVDDAVADNAGVRVKIEPVQDLHGYDHPWPAGGGKNLFDKDAVSSGSYSPSNGAFNNYGIHSDYIKVTSGQSISENKVKAIANTDGDQTFFSSWTYWDSNKQFVSGVWNGQNTVTVPDNASYLIVSTSRSIGDSSGQFAQSTVNSFLADYIIAEGATIPTYSPYSNICPITGWDGVKVTRTGKNLLDNVNPVYLNGYFNSATVLVNNNNRILIVPCTPNTAYAFTYNRVAISGTQTARIVSFESLPTYGTVGTMKAASVNESASATFTTGANDKYIGIYLGDIRTTDVSVSVTASQLELGSATDYEPYAGQTYEVELPTEAGTVYGGELTVNADGSGSLVVDRAKVTFDGTENWIKSSVQNSYYLQYNELAKIPDYTKSIVCNRLSTVKYAESLLVDYSISGFYYANYPGQNWFYIKITDDVSTASDAKKWIAENNLDVVYPLATPQTYTLTPTEIRTLLGTNNVWADTGDLALTYTGTDEHLNLESGKKYLARISGTDSMLLGSGQEITAAKGTDNVFDLTQMFGTAVADYVYGQGAAFFRKWFPNTRYPYNAGELKHVGGLQSHDMVGFNLLEDDVISGTYPEYGNRMANEKMERLIPQLAMLKKLGQTLCYRVDSNRSTAQGIQIGSMKFGVNDTIIAFTIRPNIPFNLNALDIEHITGIYVYGANPAASTTLSNVCINLAHNNSRNGEYEPYEKHSYPLDSTVILRGIPKVGANGVYWDGDRYLPDGTVERRYGVVDLGTQVWGNNTFNGISYFVTNNIIPDLKKPVDSNDDNNFLCTKYPLVKTPGVSTAFVDKTFFVFTSGYIYVRDNSFTDLASFRSAMQGVLLVYELAIPTTETAQPYRELQIVDDWGTEEFVTTGLVPVGHETQYMDNLRDKLQHLPDLASSNGIYIVKQTDSEMELLKLPDMPTTNGNYRLKLNVASGSPTFSWEVVS